MKIIDEGTPNAPIPHRCERTLWDWQYRHTFNLNAIVECVCGAHWQLQGRVSLWRQLFSDWSVGSGGAYWVRIRRAPIGYRRKEKDG